MGVFEKSQKIWQNLKKCQILSVKIYKIPYLLKPPHGKKLTKNPLKIN